MPMSEQNAINIEELWTTRIVKEGKRLFVGVQNQLPQPTRMNRDFSLRSKPHGMTEIYFPKA